MNSQRCPMHLAPVLLAAMLFAAPVCAQTAPGQTAPASDQDSITVTGQRRPAAEAPKSATCEALAQDPNIAAQLQAAQAGGVLGPIIYLPTRLPRNPDYRAAPKVAPGSALPDLGKARFGVSDKESARSVTTSMAELVPDSAESTAEDTGSGTGNEVAASACRDSYSSARNGARPASIAAHDPNLPMGFALFDQGRYAESLEWFRKAERKLQPIEGGDEASLFVGKLYLQGLGDATDPAEGITWLKKTATLPFNPVKEMPIFDPLQPERNTAIGEAAIILANVYLKGGAGVAKNPVEARKWFDRAWDVGHVPAGKIIGDLYFQGLGTPRDVKKAATWYRRAASYDVPAAQVALADILWTGDEGVPADRKEAIGWYKQAAKADNPNALVALARAYDRGENVPANAELALGFYKSAALKGSAPAQTALGVYFYEGAQVPKDYPTARRWFEAGARGGDAEGMANLAAMMIAGQGGERNRPLAWFWLRRAGTLGYGKAKAAAEALYVRLTPEERAATDRLLKPSGMGGG